MKSPIARWRLGYDTPGGERVQITEGAFDELVIPAAGIHIEVMHDGSDPEDEGKACIDVHIGELHLSVIVGPEGRRIIHLDGKFVDGLLVEDGG